MVVLLAIFLVPVSIDCSPAGNLVLQVREEPELDDQSRSALEHKVNIVKVLSYMAYGKSTTKGMEKRMAKLGRASIPVDLALLRSRHIDAVQAIADAVWPGSIVMPVLSGKDIDGAMLLAQAAQKGTLNSVWAEKARLAAKAAVTEQWKRAQKNLFGRFKHLDTVGDTPLDDGASRLLNFPEEWSRRLSATDVATLAEFAKPRDFRQSLSTFGDIASGVVPDGLTLLQAQALDSMRLMTEERFGRPVWKTEDATVQLHLDFRCFLGKRKVMDALLRTLAEDATTVVAGGKVDARTFLVSGTIARDAPICVSVLCIAPVLQRLTEAGDVLRFTSLVLELTPSELVVKGVCVNSPKSYALEEATHVLAEDFGYRNTVAWSVHPVDRPLDPEFFEKAADWSKAEAKAYLESHVHDGEPIETVLHCGQDFLVRINHHAFRIDALRSEIDRIHNRIRRIKHECCRLLGRNTEDGPLDLGMATDDGRLGGLLQRLAKLLAAAGRLKEIRRAAYRTVAGVKKCWFGWLGNRRVELARKHHAAVIREDLTVVAQEKEKPGYKGRTFNRMINNGAKGQYARRANAKLKWFGIPSAKIPSFYTSSTDVRHGIVDKKQRSGESFVSKFDGRKWHADLHAAATIALYPFLRLRLPVL